MVRLVCHAKVGSCVEDEIIDIDDQGDMTDEEYEQYCAEEFDDWLANSNVELGFVVMPTK